MCVQTSKRVLPVEQVRALLQMHVHHGPGDGSDDDCDSTLQTVSEETGTGLSWRQLQEKVLVSALPPALHFSCTTLASPLPRLQDKCLP